MKLQFCFKNRPPSDAEYEIEKILKSKTGAEVSIQDVEEEGDTITTFTMSTTESQASSVLLITPNLTRIYPSFCKAVKDTHAVQSNINAPPKSLIELYCRDTLADWNESHIELKDLVEHVAQLAGVAVDLVDVCGIVSSPAIITLGVPEKGAKTVEKSKEALEKVLPSIEKIERLPHWTIGLELLNVSQVAATVENFPGENTRKSILSILKQFWLRFGELQILDSLEHFASLRLAERLEDMDKNHVLYVEQVENLKKEFMMMLGSKRTFEGAVTRLQRRLLHQNDSFWSALPTALMSAVRMVQRAGDVSRMFPKVIKMRAQEESGYSPTGPVRAVMQVLYAQVRGGG